MLLWPTPFVILLQVARLILSFDAKWVPKSAGAEWMGGWPRGLVGFLILSLQAFVALLVLVFLSAANGPAAYWATVAAVCAVIIALGTHGDALPDLLAALRKVTAELTRPILFLIALINY